MNSRHCPQKHCPSAPILLASGPIPFHFRTFPVSTHAQSLRAILDAISRSLAAARMFLRIRATQRTIRANPLCNNPPPSNRQFNAQSLAHSSSASAKYRCIDGIVRDSGSFRRHNPRSRPPTYSAAICKPAKHFRHRLR